jgi:hypothetical protein
MHTALGKQQAVVSKEELQERERRRKGEPTVVELRHYFQNSGSSGMWNTYCSDFLSIFCFQLLY